MLIGLLNIQEFDDVMAPNFSMIGDISPDKDETMKIQAKVIRMWYGKPSKFSSEINSIDVVLLDEMVRFNSSIVENHNILKVHLLSFI